MLKLSLEKAMTKLKNGDDSTFDFIYDMTYKVVFFVIYDILQDKSLSEDIMQDTYIQAYKNKHSYESKNLLAWLTTIAKRLAINEYNRRKRVVFTDVELDVVTIERSSNLPDEDSFGLIRLAKDVLDEIDFQIVIMYAISGYKRREIGQLLGLPTSTVSYKYSQAIEKLKHLKGGNNIV